MTNSTGYGPSTARYNRLLFNGSDEQYELWEVKFLGYMRLQKLHEVIAPTATDDEAEVDGEKNALAFAELVQCLDDRSLSLILRDAVDDGRKALKILREHYLGSGKPRIIALYTELTTLVMKAEESVTDYLIRAETASTSLKSAGENISDSLLIAMILKGLPEDFKTFVAISTQKDTDQTFTEFKVALRNFQETERSRSEHRNSDKTGL